MAVKSVMKKLAEQCMDGVGIVHTYECGEPMKSFTDRNNDTNYHSIKFIVAKPNEMQLKAVNELFSQLMPDEKYVVKADVVWSNRGPSPYWWGLRFRVWYSKALSMDNMVRYVNG